MKHWTVKRRTILGFSAVVVIMIVLSLFAYERLGAFPIDVWIERVLRQHYFSRRRKMTAQRLRQFSETYFGEHGGYAQQYLFHHARMGSGRQNPKRRSTGALQNASADLV